MNVFFFLILTQGHFLRTFKKNSFRETEEGREEGKERNTDAREKYQLVASPVCSRLGIEPATLWLWDNTQTNRAARARMHFLKQQLSQCYVHRSLWLIVTEGKEKMGRAISAGMLAANFPKLMEDSRIKTKKTTPRAILKFSREKKDTLLSRQ